MTTAPRLHILGAAGSGTTTLGRALAEALDLPHYDTDAFFWEATDPPFTTPRSMPERLNRLEAALSASPGWMLSGSVVPWGDPLIPRFTLVVRLTLDPAIRMARILAREAARYGTRIEPGGDMEQANRAFLAWAAAYDTAGMEQRSQVRHEAWLARLPCPVLRLDSAAPVAALCKAVLDYIPRARR